MEIPFSKTNPLFFTHHLIFSSYQIYRRITTQYTLIFSSSISPPTNIDQHSQPLFKNKQYFQPDINKPPPSPPDTFQHHQLHVPNSLGQYYTCSSIFTLGTHLYNHISTVFLSLSESHTFPQNICW